jgi:glycine hydroxymethyltransferase
MGETEMDTIAGFIASILIEKRTPDALVTEVAAFRLPFQTVYYCFENGLPPGTAAAG